MPKRPLSDYDKVFILKYLAKGHDKAYTAACSQVSEDEVLDVASHHGWPDLTKIAHAAKLLQDKIDRDARAALADRTRGVPPPRLPTVQRRPAHPITHTTQPKESTMAVPTPEPTPTLEDAVLDVEDPTANTVAVLVGLAEKSDSKRTQNRGTKLWEEVHALVTLLGIEEEERRQAAANAERLAELKAKQEEAARLLEEANAEIARLGGTVKKTASGPSKPKDTEAAKIRAWAREKGFDVADRGRIDADLVEKYHAWKAADDKAKSSGA